MSSTFVVALIIPWIFWGILMGLLIVGRRSWINMLLIPIGITVIILLIARFTSDNNAFWGSFILHLFLFVYFLKSYISFRLKERKKNNESD